MGCSHKHLNIDLHIHSTASDGTLSPSEILTLAEKLSIGAISITDHDAVDGNREILQKKIPTPVNFLTGVEISASPPSFFPTNGSFHILGYGINVEDKALNQKLITLQDARKNRNPHIIRKLNMLGMGISMHQLKAFFGNCQLGRPHIAQYLVQKGLARSIDKAFDQYLGKGKAAYVEKYRISCQEAIQLISDAGGLPVLAHPYLLKINKGRAFEELTLTLKSMGLRGIEVYYPEHSQEMVNFYSHIAKQHQLIITGGTDFHGDIKPEIKLGTGYGNLFVPFAIYENIINFLK